MKTILKSIVVLILISNSYKLFAQTGNEIFINLDDQAGKIIDTIDEGQYDIYVHGEYDCKNQSITIEFQKNYIVYPPIQTDELLAIDKICSPFNYHGNFYLDSNMEVKIIISISENDIITKKIERVFTAIKSKKWITSFGVSAVKLIKTDTYKSIPTGDNKHQIVRSGSQDLYQAIPIMMFSVLNLKNENAWIPSGGFGIDLEDISVFAGISKSFAQNFIITGGLAFHRQLRLSNQYSNNQIVDEAVSFDDLNEKFYRINPFVSITFRLDNNIFQKK